MCVLVAHLDIGVTSVNARTQASDEVPCIDQHRNTIQGLLGTTLYQASTYGPLQVHLLLQLHQQSLIVGPCI